MTGEMFESSWTMILKYIFYKESGMVFIVVLTGILAFMLGMFLLYHFKLIGDGFTTSEYYKHNDALCYYEEKAEKLKKLN